MESGAIVTRRISYTRVSVGSLTCLPSHTPHPEASSTHHHRTQQYLNTTPLQPLCQRTDHRLTSYRRAGNTTPHAENTVNYIYGVTP